MRADKETTILNAARGLFLRYGYRRVSMSDIAAAAGVSRPALYVVFSNKEAIFSGVYAQWVEQTIAEIAAGMARIPAPYKKLVFAFELWAVRPFEVMRQSPEAKELIECGFDFAQDASRRGYAAFEATITPVLASLAQEQALQANLRPARIAHVLTSAVRGFKQTAATQAELRRTIRELLALSL